MNSNTKFVYMWFGILALVALTIGVPLNEGEEIREVENNSLAVGVVEGDNGGSDNTDSRPARVQLFQLGKPNEEQSALRTFLGRKESHPDNDKIDREKDSANLKRSVEKGNIKKKDGTTSDLTMYGGEKPRDPRSQIVMDSERRCWKVADGWRCLVTFDEDKDNRNW